MLQKKIANLVLILHILKPNFIIQKIFNYNVSFLISTLENRSQYQKR